jgi:hypothetical protein
MGINYITGDATPPQGEGVKIIAHVCNDVEGWGRGFVLVVSKRWPQSEREYPPPVWSAGVLGNPGQIQRWDAKASR